MIYKRSKMLALLLSFMMIALNMFTGVGPMYSYAETETDSQPAAELAGDKDQADADQTYNDQLDKEQTEDTSMAKEAEETALPGEEAESAHGDAAEESATEVSEEAKGEAAAEEAGEVAFDQSKTVDGVKVRVSADGGVFPEGSTLKVKKLSGETKAEAEAAVHEETAEGDIAKEYLFDITILDKEGNEIQPEGKANVSFETSEVADETLQAKVYHVKDNGKAEALDVDASGEIAQVETRGFSPYSLIFSYTDSSGTTKSINLRVGETEQIGPVLDKIGITNGEQDARGGIKNAVSDAPDIVRVYEHEWAGWFLKAEAGDENEHHLTVTFEDDYQVIVKVTSHKHHWNATGDKSDAVTIVCEDTQNCYYFNNTFFDDKGFTAQIIAEDATYDGQPHEAKQVLQQRFPTPDVTVEKDIHYEGIDGTTYADSTTAPTDAGKYKAYYQIEPQGQDDVFTVQTEYTIKKADINFDPAPAAVSNLIYSGEEQELYTTGTAKSTTVSSKTFPIKYWFAEDSSQKVEDQVLKGKEVGTYKVSYQAEGDANHNKTEVKTIEIKIGKRPVKVSGITAGNKTYDGTTKATLNCDNAEFADILEGDTLTVSAQGTFADKNAGDNKTVNITGMTLGGADVDKYTLATSGQQESATANIAQKILKVKWQESDELPYTGEEQAPKAEFEFAQDLSTDDGKAYTGDDVQPVVAGKHKLAGTVIYTASVNSLSGGDAANYKLDPTSSNVKMVYKIVPKKITVVWKTVEKEYAAKGLEPDWELTGFVGGDQPNKHLSLTANPTELVSNKAVNAGTYKALLELTGETASNYEITNPETTFTITKAPLKVYAQGWIYYGDNVETKTDIHDIKFIKDKCEGFKGTEGVEILNGDAEFTTDYKFKDNATGVDDAKYNLKSNIEETANYTVTNKDGELKVYPKPVVLEWTREHDGTETDVSGEQALTYDGKEYKFTAKVNEDSYVKTPKGQQADEVTVKTYDGNVQKNANAKTKTDKYTAEAMTLSNPNYALKNKEGKAIDTKTVDFTIAQLPIQFDWATDTFTYNGKEQTIRANISNLANGDSDPLAYEGQTEKDAGDYTAKITGVVDANYTIREEDEGKLKQAWKNNPLPVELTWTDGNKTYNGEEQSVWADVSNVVTGDQLLLTYADNTKKAVGSYTARVTEIDNPNYTLDGATGLNMEWKIGKRAGTVGTPRLTNVAANSSKKTNTGSWRTVSGAKGYEFAWKTRTAKKFTTMKVGRKSYAVAPRMVSKGLYEYKVRAIKGETSTDKAITGKWSNSLYRYYFTLQKIRLKNEKGGFTVSWQRDSYATGYQVMYSTNKKGTNPKIITMSGNSVTKRTVKGLKKGTVYYVQIRAIKKVGGINYMGNISNPKPVKAF